jgi:hypothetical protein
MLIGTLIVAGLAWAKPSFAAKASVDNSGLDEESRALIAKERARAQMYKARRETGDTSSNAGGDSGKSADASKDKTSVLLDKNRPIYKEGGVTGGCSIDIGNSEKRAGESGKPKPVIITGPVVQLCK